MLTHADLAAFSAWLEEYENGWSSARGFIRRGDLEPALRAGPGTMFDRRPAFTAGYIDACNRALGAL